MRAQDGKRMPYARHHPNLATVECVLLIVSEADVEPKVCEEESGSGSASRS